MKQNQNKTKKNAALFCRMNSIKKYLMDIIREDSNKKYTFLTRVFGIIGNQKCLANFMLFEK